MNDLIIFTHIPKTSGISLLGELILPNFEGKQLYGYRKLRLFIKDMRRDYRFVRGHVPFGLHRFTRRPVKYMTFLREPIERAVSFYYFVLQNSDDPKRRHPLCDYAQSVTLAQFYQNMQFQNDQTRFLAGFLSHKFYRLFGSQVMRPYVLRTAKEHLRNHYACFGLLEEREKSLELFRHQFGWTQMQRVAPMQRTRDRPQVSDLDSDTLAILKAANSLDIQLYNYAVKLFHEKYDKHIASTHTSREHSS